MYLETVKEKETREANVKTQINVAANRRMSTH